VIQPRPRRPTVEQAQRELPCEGVVLVNAASAVLARELAVGAIAVDSLPEQQRAGSHVERVPFACAVSWLSKTRNSESRAAIGLTVTVPLTSSARPTVRRVVSKFTPSPTISPNGQTGCALGPCPNRRITTIPARSLFLWSLSKTG